MRKAVAVLREMQLVKSSDVPPAIKDVMLADLQRELKQITDQLSLELSSPAAKK